MLINFQRANDTTYRLHFEKEEQSKEIFLNYKGHIGSESYKVTKKIGEWIANQHLGERKECIVEVLGNKYKITQTNITKLQRLARFITHFFKFYKNPSNISINIEPLNLQRKTTDSSKEVFKTASLPEENQLSAFGDGYTKLARLAFQKFEPEFAPHDSKQYADTDSDHSQFKIIESDGSLKLVHKNSALKDEGPAMPKYLDFMRKEYGEEKINYIIYHYKINWAGPLTPEVIYRINIGLGNLEKQDLSAFIEKMQKKPTLDQLTQQELRGIAKAIHSELPLNKEQLEGWIDEFSSKTLDEQQAKAISILSFSPEERELQLTGRKIVYPILSHYTIADTIVYKPWVDQQELLQIFSDLENSTLNNKESWDNYCELLSHVVCKKHLARQHPVDGYRIGALIPAPRDSLGNSRWYVVSSCVSNGKGIHAYTLEPLNGDMDELPAIKLYRSTASSNYALDNRATISNDINPINSPGYEGFELGERYEEEFFKKRSLPLWVGYTLQAIKAKPEEQKTILVEALTSYSKELLRPYSVPPLAKVIRDRDAELIELAQELIKENISNLPKVLRLTKIFFKYKKEYDLKNQKKDAEFILSLIDPSNLKYETLVNNLKKVQGQYSASEKLDMDNKLQLISDLNQLLNKDCEQLAAFLYTLADEAEELPQHKSLQSIIFTGHSLGGACAQKSFVNYIGEKERIPITKEAIEVVSKLNPDVLNRQNLVNNCNFTLRTFDPPAINEKDNQAFLEYGKHASLFKWLGAKFSIIHRLEAGDFVSQGGQEHLGACTDEQRTQFREWCSFETSVSEGLTHSTISAIRDTPVAHATQFERGKRQNTFKAELEAKEEYLGDYIRTWIDPVALKKFDHGEKKSWKSIQSVFKQVGIKSHYVERVRSMAAVSIRILLFKVYSEINPGGQGHGNWWKYRDSNGVFALNLQGILSSHQ